MEFQIETFGETLDLVNNLTLCVYLDLRLRATARRRSGCPPPEGGELVGARRGHARRQPVAEAAPQRLPLRPLRPPRRRRRQDHHTQGHRQTAAPVGFRMHFVGPSLVTFRLANQMPEPKLLLHQLGSSNHFRFSLQVSPSITTALPWTRSKHNH